MIDKLRSPWVLCYLDDIIVHSRELQAHVEELRKVLQMHREAGIKLTAKKTALFRSEVDYLGFRVAQDGIHMKEDYIEKVVEWPAPKTVRQLDKFS